LVNELQKRVRNKLHRFFADNFARRPFFMAAPRPYISFTFDDFPRSAFLNGSCLLSKYAVRGTFFVSMGLLNTESSSGRIATLNDLHNLLREGHEIGCHTFDHRDGWSTSPAAFERSVKKNRRAFNDAFPTEYLEVFAYPLNGPKLKVKRIIGKKFLCCRGGGQGFNRKLIDLNLLKAFFLDWRNQDNFALVRQLIDENNAAHGWLIFATHDISTEPSKYGCTPDFFESIVRYAAQSGACILPVAKICQELDIISYEKSTTSAREGTLML